jgi:nicotinamide riboside kinase
MFLRSFLDYDLIVNVRREKPYQKDGCRAQDEAAARQIDSMVVQEVRNHGFPMLEVAGSTTERVATIVERIEKDGCVPSKRET